MSTITQTRAAKAAANYNTTFPDRVPLLSTDEWVVGTWCIGACYKNPNELYGAYPHGYLERVHSMFPDAAAILHVFSGGLDAGFAQDVITDVCGPGDREIELIDCKGPEDGRFPTWQGDVAQLPEEWAGRFDLILADPPYSKEDAEVYGTKMPNVSAVMRELARVSQPGATLVWLDTRWPMHSKKQWRTYGHIGLVRSTNHRVRLVSLFEAVEGGGIRG